MRDFVKRLDELLIQTEAPALAIARRVECRLSGVDPDKDDAFQADWNRHLAGLPCQGHMRPCASCTGKCTHAFAETIFYEGDELETHVWPGDEEWAGSQWPNHEVWDPAAWSEPVQTDYDEIADVCYSDIPPFKPAAVTW